MNDPSNPPAGPALPKPALVTSAHAEPIVGKPGWQTSEFWLTVGVTVVGGLAALETSSDPTLKTIGIIAALLANAWYTRERTNLKKGK
jgi:hypothetical protein